MMGVKGTQSMLLQAIKNRRGLGGAPGTVGETRSGSQPIERIPTKLPEPAAPAAGPGKMGHHMLRPGQGPGLNPGRKILRRHF